MTQELYGPNHSAVRSFVEGLSVVPWFRSVGEARVENSELIRMDLDYLIAIQEKPYQLWGSLLLDHEVPIDRLILDNCRLGFDSALQDAVRITGDAVDDFYLGLAEDYPGYYEDSLMHVYELVDPPPDRLVLYAAREVLVADLAPELHFFTELMEWFRRGHWPLGWQGSWPAGKLILW